MKRIWQLTILVILLAGLSTLPAAAQEPEFELPSGVRLGALVRGDDQVIIPDGDTVIKPHDHVILMALRDQIKQLQHLFRVSLEYF